MAPTKRSRRVVDDDEEQDEVIDTREARSNFQPDERRKRVRISSDDQTKEPTPQRDETPSDDSEDEDRQRADTPPQTQYELMRDAGFRHLENTDWDDQQANQKLMQRTRRIGNNMASEGGIIESITCCNFMCHTRLHVELGPLINFIVGENGSGKSAVLTALTLCLGGKASDTNRGGSMKTFVKEGCEQGSLAVKIKNAGSDAYMPDVYGESIVVERHFSKTGASRFKIKSATGRVISTKKQEVDEISEWYALQIGNPLTVLSQDNARQFLNAATPAQKYKYFVSGVQLEQLDNDYKMSQDTLDKTLNLRDDLTAKIAHVKKEMDDAVRLAETAAKNQTLREKARHYRNQLVWSQVVEQERLLQAREDAIVKRDTAIAEAQEYCNEKTLSLTAAEEKMERAKQAKENIETEKEAYVERVQEAEAVFHKARKEVTDLHRDERDAHGRLQKVKGEIKSLKNKIQQEEYRLGESTGSARAEKDAELVEATAKEKALMEQINDSTQQLPVLETRLQEAEQVSKRHQQAKEHKRKDILVAEQHVSQLQKSTGSPLDGFDRDMHTLVQAVANDGGFQQKPIGPIGARVRLTKPEWSGILEKTLGDALNAFIVRSKPDQTRLSSIMRRIGMKRPPPIYIAYANQLDTSSQEPDPQYDTILRLLQFDEEVIRSQLIINNTVEKVILIKERTEAQRVMVDNVPPRNVAACICFHDGRGKRGHGLRLTNRNGAIGTSPVTPNGQRPRMQSDSARQVALQKENLNQLALELREINSEHRQAEQALQKCRSELNGHHKKGKELENALRRTQADMERISMELDAFEGVDDRLNTLRTTLEETLAEEDQVGNLYGGLRLTKNDLNVKAEEAKAKLGVEKAELADFQGRLNKAQEKINTIENLRRLALSQKNEAFERLDIEKAERRRAVQKCEQKQKEVEEFTEEALKMSPDRVHIPDDENHQSIEKKYEKIRDQLKTREKRLGATDKEIYDRSTAARAKYADVIKQTRDVDDTIASLKRAIEHRLHLWRQFQRQISARIRIQFNYLLSERGFRGKIDLDHRARKVLIQIEPDETRKSSAGRNTKTLSGGEKSFSSICMLLSVWEAIGSPIRCLDEFDVFMDNVNRAISTNMLVDAARRSVSRQYILITPNAIEGRARLDKDVKIIRLVDPRQRTLV
ncbi:P-loop containing nucleoside triphosphate hydrolase protein [Thelonectria olida]|uniref:P-loop containing nucleoside triphosphate hydrolase protein n=1 Tax=Thelonectria olida TaxID=1576542 RepID=A0A9P8W6V2_9HYPO|nr:P-loop containing nucleoside triphosphate hydrolase protein [Thelonectria olida]